jgi:hypothetical protein
MPSVMIAEYLDETEAAELRDRLKSRAIAPVVKRHGLPRLFGTMANYRVFVERTAFPEAEKIAGEFTAECAQRAAAKKESLMKQCPHCSSPEIEERKKNSLLMRMRFFGVTVIRCKMCGGEWYI